MRAERDRWMEEAEREDCERGTDGEKKVTAAKKETEGREKRETDLTEKRGMVGGYRIEEER